MVELRDISFTFTTKPGWHFWAAPRSPPFLGRFLGSSQLLLRPYFLSLQAYFWNLFGVRLSLQARFGNILGSVPSLLLELTQELAFVLLFLKCTVFYDTVL